MIEPSWVGRRISVRRVLRRDPDGRLHHGDVVGDLVDLDDDRAIVESHGGLVEIPLPLVTIARIAPPSTADELALEAVIAAGWRPAETAELDGWRLRAGDGFTKRANSVLPLRQLRRPLDEALAAAHEWYAERGLPLQFQLPTEARRLLDAELGERGWEPSIDVAVLVARLDARVAASGASAPGSSAPGSSAPPEAFASAPNDDWLAVWRGGSAPPDAPALLTRHPDVVFVSMRSDGRTVAVGRGTIDDEWLGISCVEVDPAYRRRGLATAIVTLLEQWGTGRAVRSVLEVESDNAAALTTYESLGYRHHHDYRYRTEPSAGPPTSP